MIDIIVQRDAGDRPGEDVVDGLLGSLPAAIARGRAELDEQARLLQPVTAETLFRVGLRLGHTVRFQDELRGTWTGKLSRITHRGVRGKVTTTLGFKRAAIQ